jgi:excisionase family DNA binding protein
MMSPTPSHLAPANHPPSFINPTPTPPENDVLDINALAKLLHIHRVTCTLKAQAGEIPGRQIGNRWRFSRKKIMEWLETAA